MNWLCNVYHLMAMNLAVLLMCMRIIWLQKGVVLFKFSCCYAQKTDNKTQQNNAVFMCFIRINIFSCCALCSSTDWNKMSSSSWEEWDLRLPNRQRSDWLDLPFEIRWNSKVNSVNKKLYFFLYYAMSVWPWLQYNKCRFTGLQDPNDYSYSYNPCVPYQGEYDCNTIHVSPQIYCTACTVL